jgi:hypothetical protein
MNTSATAPTIPSSRVNSACDASMAEQFPTWRDHTPLVNNYGGSVQILECSFLATLLLSESKARLTDCSSLW